MVSFYFIAEWLMITSHSFGWYVLYNEWFCSSIVFHHLILQNWQAVDSAYDFHCETKQNYINV